MTCTHASVAVPQDHCCAPWRRWRERAGGGPLPPACERYRVRVRADL